jgi:hypothetical protein
MQRAATGNSFLVAVALTWLTGSSAALAQAQALPPGYDPGGLGDYMNIFIQPRHAKLGLAGRERNWPLANYAFKELHQSLNNTAKAIPKFRTLSVPDMFDALLGEPRKAIEEAIKARDGAKFDAAYAQLTAGCNACHTAANLPFIVIKAPEQSNFPNQDFLPKR